MSISTPNLGAVISNATIRKIVYSTYVLAIVVAGAAQVYFGAVGLEQPVILVGALAVLAYLGIPVGSLALANTPKPEVSE